MSLEMNNAAAYNEFKREEVFLFTVQKKKIKNRFFLSYWKSQGRKKPKPPRKKKKWQSLESKLRSLIKNFQCLRTSLTAKSNPKIIEKLSKATQRPKKYSYGSDSDTGDFFQEIAKWHFWTPA